MHVKNYIHIFIYYALEYKSLGFGEEEKEIIKIGRG